jgi:hypothetical protein
MVGVAQAAVFQGFQNAGHGPVVETVPPSRWKKLATGYGAIPKPQKKDLGRRPEFEDYRVAVWARELGYTGSSWDEADATGVAEAARRTIALEVR